MSLSGKFLSTFAVQVTGPHPLLDERVLNEQLTKIAFCYSYNYCMHLS